MKLILPLLLTPTLSSFGAVTFDFPNGLLFSQSNPTQQVGTFVLTSTTSGATPLSNSTPIQAFQIPGTSNVAIQGTDTDFNPDPTISLMSVSRSISRELSPHQALIGSMMLPIVPSRQTALSLQDKSPPRTP